VLWVACSGKPDRWMDEMPTVVVNGLDSRFADRVAARPPSCTMPKPSNIMLLLHNAAWR
jgi:hypothetical protein